jgi:hypothetical protein
LMMIPDAVDEPTSTKSETPPPEHRGFTQKVNSTNNRDLSAISVQLTSSAVLPLLPELISSAMSSSGGTGAAQSAT